MEVLATIEGFNLVHFVQRTDLLALLILLKLVTHIALGLLLSLNYSVLDLLLNLFLLVLLIGPNLFKSSSMINIIPVKIFLGGG